MDYNEARIKLEKYGQEHVFKIAEKFGYSGDIDLIKQIELTDFEVIESGRTVSKEKRGIVTPINVMSVDEIAANEEQYRETGIHAIRDGKVGAVLLAGGM